MTTKRTMGQCTCTMAATSLGYTVGHLPDCPALYPLQRQPGDEKDALTRLVAHVRTAWDLGRSSTMLLSAQEWEEAAIDLISEARGEHKRLRQERFDALNARTTDGLSAAEWQLRTGKAEREREELRHELAISMDALLATQKHMGEVRQQNLDEGREQGHLDAFLWLRAHHDGILKPTADDMRVALAEMMDGK